MRRRETLPAAGIQTLAFQNIGRGYAAFYILSVPAVKCREWISI
jgi:hypothetical protein